MDLMKKVGEFARDHDAFVQSHLSENRDEVAWIRQLFPSQPSYAGVYDSAARYTAGATDYYTPARLDEPVLAAAGAAALAAHRVLGLRDLSRTDLVVDASGTPWFLEVNVAPGMTETSLLPMAVAEAGLDLGVVCRDLLAAAVARG